MALTEAQRRNAAVETDLKPNVEEGIRDQIITELRSALEAERSGTARLERALATALADNAALAVEMAAVDRETTTIKTQLSPDILPDIAENSALDSFLAD